MVTWLIIPADAIVRDLKVHYNHNLKGWPKVQIRSMPGIILKAVRQEFRHFLKCADIR